MTSETKKRIATINSGIIPEGYKKTKVGIVPVEWEVTNCQSVCKKIIAGATPSTKIADYWNGDICWMSSGEINKRVIIDTETKITQSGYDSCSTKMIPEKCVLIALAGQGKTRGTVAYNLIPICTNQSLASLIPNTINYLYLYYFLDLQYQNLRTVSSGDGSRGGLNLEIISNFKIIVPSLPEQQKIAEILSTQDKLIELQERKIKQLKTLKKGYLQKMFPKKGSSVPELRFKGFSDPWEQRKLSQFVDFYSGLTYSPNDVQEYGTLVLRSSNVKNGAVVDSDNVYVNDDVVNSENVRCGDIIVVVRNGSRALIGKHAEIRKEMPKTVIGAFMTGIRSKHPSFVNALLSTQQFENEVSMNMGATINQITGYMFEKMSFTIPNSEEQDRVGLFFKDLDHLITLHQRKLDEEKQKKKALMQLLLTGKVRVV